MVAKEELDYEEALLAVDDLLEIFQELYYRLENMDDLDAYGAREALKTIVEQTLIRYEALEE